MLSNSQKALVAFVAVIIVGVIVWSSFIVTVPNGYVGVVYDASRGGVTNKDLHPGWNFKMPFVQRVTAYPTAFRTYTMSSKDNEGAKEGNDSVKITTKDNQTLNQDVSLTYQIIPGKAQQIYRNFKGANIESIEDTFVRRSLITAVSTKAGPQFNILDAYGSQKAAFEKEIFNQLNPILKVQGFEVVTINLGEGYIPGSVKQAIEAPLKAQAATKEAEAQLAMKEAQAKQQVIQAQAYADALKIRSEAEATANQKVANSLSPLLVEKIRIEKINPKVQVIYLPANTNLFTGLPK